MSASAVAPVAKPTMPKVPLTPFQRHSRGFMAGAICAATTHVIVVPLDVVKTRIQLDPTMPRATGAAIRAVMKTGGTRALLTGLSPTGLGYALQGGLKFSLYDVFREMIAPGQERPSMGINLLGSAMAETVASTVLCPFEALRIRMVNNPETYRSMIGSTGHVIKHEGFGAMYRALPSILLKQIPYSMTQLSAFSLLNQYTYDWAVPKFLGKKKSDLPAPAVLGVSLGLGTVAGFLSAIASHPPDTLLTMMNKSDAKGKSMLQVARGLGFKGLWAGLFMRCGMVAGWSAAQFFIIDSIKVMVGVPTTK